MFPERAAVAQRRTKAAGTAPFLRRGRIGALPRDGGAAHRGVARERNSQRAAGRGRRGPARAAVRLADVPRCRAAARTGKDRRADHYAKATPSRCRRGKGRASMFAETWDCLMAHPSRPRTVLSPQPVTCPIPNECAVSKLDNFPAAALSSQDATCDFRPGIGGPAFPREACRHILQSLKRTTVERENPSLRYRRPIPTNSTFSCRRILIATPRKVRDDCTAITRTPPRRSLRQGK
jgi:hypothetical protein